MPWKEQSKTMLREELIREVTGGKLSKSGACRKYGISRNTVYKWLERYENGETLEDRSRRPHTISNQTSEYIEEIIIEYRTEHPALGAAKIRRMMQDDGIEGIPSVSTVNAILSRNGLISREASEKSKPYVRFEMAEPNDMWQADFKGHFLLGNTEECHPLNIIDDHSRMCLCSDALPGETLDDIQKSIIRTFHDYGLPKSLLCDNGNPWGVTQCQGITRFEIMLMNLGVLPLHCRPHHPQTQGKEERFNGTQKRELISIIPMTDLSDAQRRFDEYREFYNNRRPHHALNLDTPAAHYVPSPRKMPVAVTDWDYDDDYTVKRVNAKGFLNFSKSVGCYLGDSFAGMYVAYKPSIYKDKFTIFYRQFIVAEYDAAIKSFAFKRAYLIEGDPRVGRRVK